MADLSSIARDLYGVPLKEFVVARDERATTARAEGDRDLSEQIRALRKPSATAWIVNLLARERPELVQEVLDLGEELREAQADPDGERLRILDQQRRLLLTRVALESSGLARRHDQSYGPAATASVDETVRAAMADTEAGLAVQAGMLVSGLSAAGFGFVDLSDAVAMPGTLPGALPGALKDVHGPARSRRTAANAAILEVARQAVAKAKRESTESATTLKLHKDARASLELRRAALQQQLVDLLDLVSGIEAGISRADSELRAFKRDIEQASSAEAAAVRALDRAQSRLRKLT